MLAGGLVVVAVRPDDVVSRLTTDAPSLARLLSKSGTVLQNRDQNKALGLSRALVHLTP